MGALWNEKAIDRRKSAACVFISVLKMSGEPLSPDAGACWADKQDKKASPRCQLSRKIKVEELRR